MKKIFTLISFLVMAATTWAADNYQFVDKDGNTIASGSTIECTEATDDGFGDIIIHSGLFLKNVDAPDNYQVSVQANIKQIDNGKVQLCFPTNCFSYGEVGTHGGEQKGTIAKGAKKDLQTEWVPTAYGECVVEYTAQAYQGVFKKGTCTVTVHYKYLDPAGITSADASRAVPVQCYDLQGRQQLSSRRGLSVVRMSDGSVRKIYNTK